MRQDIITTNAAEPCAGAPFVTLAGLQTVPRSTDFCITFLGAGPGDRTRYRISESEARFMLYALRRVLAHRDATNGPSQSDNSGGKLSVEGSRAPGQSV